MFNKDVSSLFDGFSTALAEFNARVTDYDEEFRKNMKNSLCFRALEKALKSLRLFVLSKRKSLSEWNAVYKLSGTAIKRSLLILQGSLAPPSCFRITCGRTRHQDLSSDGNLAPLGGVEPEMQLSSRRRQKLKSVSKKKPRRNELHEN